jgi:hypothetical protein
VRVAPLSFLTLLIAAVAGTSSAQAAFNCSASAARITVLGQKIEPVTANAGGTECAGESKTVTGQDLGLPAPLSLAGVAASTEFHPVERAVVASGGIADLKVAALPTLPIQLPALPDAVKNAVSSAVPSISLAPVKSAIPVLPTNLPTDLVTNLVQLALSNPLLSPLQLQNLADTNAATNAANQATNLANEALNTLRNSIPDTLAVDTSILDGILKLPSLDLLNVRSAIAYAAGSCATGTPVVGGQSTIAGVKILGQDIEVGQGIDRALEIKLDAAQAGLVLADLGLTEQQTQLIAATQAAQTALTTALTTVNDAIKTALAGLELPSALAQVKITPGAQIKTADSVTQQALNINVTLLGQQLLDAVIGEATASSAGVDCGQAVADPNTPAGATLACSTEKLVLVDVLERAGRVKLYGVADPALAGKTVDIVFDATNRVVAHAKVEKDGTFDTTAPLPPANLRDTNDARYMAKLGKEESINLKLRRRMVIDSMTAKGRRVTITGRVIAPFAKPMQKITLKRQVSCTKDTVVKRFKPRSNGRFKITVTAPKNLGTAVYRMTTKVRNSSTGTSLFDTFTLPRAVDLDR